MNDLTQKSGTPIEPEALIADLRLIAAWHTPAGPTPRSSRPNVMKTCLAAADALAALPKTPEPPKEQS